MEHKFNIETLADLDDLSVKIIALSEAYKVFIFNGDLGSGKTTLIKKLIAKLGCDDHVSSPTFSIVNEYSGPIYHFDLYRIKDTEELEDIGFFQYLDSGNYCFIEWPGIAVPYLDMPFVEIKMSILENNTRNVLILGS
ncbi:tRNA (adenosine(37)-N6)-threonylcarbamoyltransferase complex ATPase subunit type 1 TsaE [Portibacter lacus]|uniref:tRNA threonylcarbamoyladenosine biosynthesis protein TsaE n=1 Tax=Portibacter lacus TaxID=1099794 RepID=A0AA37SSV3_9BACT|nr:tRNA (adenosine(37)-N6)-threonylcarbamoyltransferase complex ATPase subunit type 1 TsaE [Portibacter lacus]GLR18126.1 tRNA (adenosine(37)-N6)-threonylcarbamoyltransferase complex ATPase subunit type 1 TsaE [Portibacter lacus]